MIKSEYLTEYDGIVNTMQMYVDGSKQGKSELMRPAFTLKPHSSAMLATNSPLEPSFFSTGSTRTVPLRISSPAS